MDAKTIILSGLLAARSVGAGEPVALSGCECAPYMTCLARVSLAHEKPRYNYAVHYGVTSIVAMAAGWSAERAGELAYWAVYPDLTWTYSAITGIALNTDLGYSIQRYGHSLRGGSACPVRKQLAYWLTENREAPVWQSGLSIHALGDSFAHAKDDGTECGTLYRWPLGHLWAGHAPDAIANDPVKFGEFADLLYSVLEQAQDTRPSVMRDLKDFVRSCPIPRDPDDETCALSCFGTNEHLPAPEIPTDAPQLSRSEVADWISMLKQEENTWTH